MITSFFDKISSLTKEQQDDLVRQLAEDEKKDAAERREQKRLRNEKDTRKRLRDLEAHLYGKGPGRPKKEKMRRKSILIRLWHQLLLINRSEEEFDVALGC